MARNPEGPRQLKQGGQWYACKLINGKRRCISLGTRVKAEAWKKWPAAQAELEALAHPQPGLAGEPHLVWDVESNTAKWEPSPWDPEEQGQLGLITWAQAIQIQAKRFERRNGRAPSRSWFEAVAQATKLCDKQPEQWTPQDCRQYMDRLESLGQKATTVSQRAALLSGLFTGLIKSGTLPSLINPWSLVDYGAVSNNHHSTASPEQMRLLWDLRDHLPYGSRFVLEVLMYSGARVGEVTNGDYSEAGWLALWKRKDWAPKNSTSEREVPIPEWIQASYKLGGSSLPTAQVFRRHLNKVKKQSDLRNDSSDLRNDSSDLGGIITTNVTPHSLRHSFKTAARVAAADELTIETLMGHAAGSRMSRTYGRYPRELLVREAEKVWAVLDSWVARVP
jgi:integrase